ncbi:MAG TPA: hypothetical protein VJP76_06515, partial [Candidatus Tumulicola sp.]|nr:hypothetical protein [Candidatus Tumulicola sp.]
ADYIAKVSAAAPAAVVKGATIVQMGKGGTMRTLQTGTNGFTCLMAGTDAMCADKNAMAWIHAMIAHASPPNVVGFAYMLAGDQGGSNTDPMASAKTADNHWVVTGPHLMMFAPSATTMGYPTTADADPSAPYVMWANTRYAHVMIPVSAAP